MTTFTEADVMGDFIVGPRYRMADVTTGVRSVKLEQDRGMGGSKEGGGFHAAHEPIEVPRAIAGAIRRSVWQNGATKGQPRWVASCQLCAEHSKGYTRKNEPALWRWARGHRCSTVQHIPDSCPGRPCSSECDHIETLR